MPFIVFGCVLAATAYTNVFSFVLQWYHWQSY